jgi:gluconokinase
MLIFLFGLPGVGKNFVGELLQEQADCYFYDADQDITAAMKTAIKNGVLYTQAMRDDYYKIVIEHVRALQQKHARLVIAQGLSKNRHRAWFKEVFPELQFFWVQAEEELMLARLKQRKSDLVITPEYAQLVKTAFEAPDLPHQVIHNNGGKAELLAQLTGII